MTVRQSKGIRWMEHVAWLGKKRNLYKSLIGIINRRDHMEDLCTDGRVILITLDLKKIGWECVDWIHLAPDRDQWRALVNTVMKLRHPCSN
jgi:hypothetical protein